MGYFEEREIKKKERERERKHVCEGLIDFNEK